MANHCCHGDRFEVDGFAFYRCMWDGTVMAVHVAPLTSCPHCNRPVDARDHGIVKAIPVTYKRVVLQWPTQEIEVTVPVL